MVFKKKKKFKPRACAHHFTRIFAFSVGKQHAALPTTKKKKKKKLLSSKSPAAHMHLVPLVQICKRFREVGDRVSYSSQST